MWRGSAIEQEPAASFNLRRPRSSSAGAGMGTVATHDGRSRLLQYVAAFDYNVRAPHTVLWRGSGLSFCSARDTEPPATGVALLLPVRLLSRQAGARADTLRPSRRSCRCRQLGRRPSRHRACRYCPSCRRRAACRRSSCQGIVARAACRPSCRRRAARRPRPKAGAAASSARFLRTAVMLCTGCGVSFGYGYV